MSAMIGMLLGMLLAAAQGGGILFWLGIIAIVAGVIVMIMGRLLVGVVLLIIGFLLAFGGVGLNVH